MTDYVGGLVLVSEGLREIEQRRDALLADRNRTIAQALAAGVKQSEVARITGLSRQRIHQIAERKV